MDYYCWRKKNEVDIDNNSNKKKKNEENFSTSSRALYLGTNLQCQGAMLDNCFADSHTRTFNSTSTGGVCSAFNSNLCKFIVHLLQRKHCQEDREKWAEWETIELRVKESTNVKQLRWRSEQLWIFCCYTCAKRKLLYDSNDWQVFAHTHIFFVYQCACRW